MKKVLSLSFVLMVLGSFLQGQVDDLNFNINGTHTGTVKFSSVEFLSTELGVTFKADEVQVGNTYPVVVSEAKRFDDILKAGIGAADPSENWVANAIGEKVEIQINSNSNCEMYIPAKRILAELFYNHDKNMWAVRTRFNVNK